MLGEDSLAITITFVLALAGYVGLTTTVLLSATGGLPRRLWIGTVVIIVLHVAMVWTYRYQGEVSLATRNGVAGFLLFHGALVVILASAVARGTRAILGIRIAFVIVSLGATGAVFRYPVVEAYRVPVLFCMALGAAGLARGLSRGAPPSTPRT